MYLKVTVIPEAKKEEIAQDDKGNLLIAVREPAQRNLANKRVLELLKSLKELPKGEMKIISGHHSPHKMIWINSDD